MSDQEIIDAMKGEAVRVPKEAGWRIDAARVGIENWPIGDHNYHVYFFTGTDGVLKKVQISPHSVVGPYGLPVHPPVFEELNRLLTEKYGKPDTETSTMQEGVDTVTESWIFESHEPGAMANWSC
jgi:hypothetical protein